MSIDASSNPDPEIAAGTASATGNANVASPAAIGRTLARHPRPLGRDTARSTLGTSSLSLTGMVLDNQSSAQQMRERGTATIMILGDTCTRSCGFCNVKTGKPMPVDDDEPRRVAEALAQIGLKHVVITSVDRDDQPDGGARIWAETIQAVHEMSPETSVEVLVGDFKGVERDIQLVCDARPEIISHNMETVNRMHPAVRPQARYDRSLKVLQQFKANGLVTKTGIMLGIGEHEHEVLELLDDVRAWSDCDILTIGQYLQPTRNHLPIDRWVHPDEFARLREAALERGFEVCESGPLVRSSYHAEEQAEKLSPERADVHGRMKKLIAQARDRGTA